MAVVETIDLKKHFDEVKAVDGVDLSIREGEFLVILGPSGCGKTTLMRMIAGLERPTAGDVLIGNQVVTELPPPGKGDRNGLPELRSIPAYDGFRQHRLPAQSQVGAQDGGNRKRGVRSRAIGDRESY